MLEVEFIRKFPEKVKEGIEHKNKSGKLVDKFLRLDEEWRAKVSALAGLRAEQNALSGEIAKQRSEDLLAKGQVLKKRIGELEAQEVVLAKKRNEALLELPNLPFENVPVGKDASENRVLKEKGARRHFSFTPKDYFSLAKELALIDTDRAAKVAGSRFGYLLNDAAILEFGLISLTLKIFIPKGFIPVIPPVFIRPEVFERMGRISGDQKEERYYLQKDNLYLVGSAEHTIGPLHMDDCFEADELPRRYIGFSTCFRREAGTYGKDTRGILRVHQFDKMELFSFVAPERSEEEHRFLLSCQEEFMELLQLPYRVMELCTGDMGWTDARQFDIETWFPATAEYRETHSCSNTTDFQARGINAKVKTREGKKEFVHMLNATACAMGRTIAAIIENYQTKKGTIEVPEVLREYVGKKEIVKKV